MRKNMLKKYVKYAKQYTKYVISRNYDRCLQKHALYEIKYAEYVILKKYADAHIADDSRNSLAFSSFKFLPRALA